MPRVLVVEDEADLQAVLEYNLTQSGYDVVLARDGATALEQVRTTSPDLILLDLMLPDLSGTEICRAIKADPATNQIPIIMVTARGEEVDRVVGFELGAEDYVSKPFSVRELLLRVRAVLKRAAPQKSNQKWDPIFEFGCLRLDRDAHRVWVEEREVGLTKLEFRLLLTLIQYKNRVQSRSALLSKVWDVRSDVTTRTVDTHVKRLREKMGAASSYIETVRGVGYRFLDAPPNGLSATNNSPDSEPPRPAQH